MAKVTFNGTVLLDDAEGTFDYAPGVFVPRHKDFEEMARSIGMLTRELSTRGAIHVVTLRFRAVTASTIINRIRNAYNSGEGTLLVNGFPSVPHCEMLPPPPFGNAMSTARVSGASRAQGMIIPLGFMQVEG